MEIKDEGYEKFIDMIKRKDYKYSLLNTVKRKISDFFSSLSFEDRVNKTFNRVLIDKKATCWDLAMGMKFYLTNKLKLKNWIVAYNIKLGLPHTFNLVNWWIFNIKGSSLVYPLSITENVTDFRNDKDNVWNSLVLIDPLCSGSTTRLINVTISQVDTGPRRIENYAGNEMGASS